MGSKDIGLVHINGRAADFHVLHAALTFHALEHLVLIQLHAGGDVGVDLIGQAGNLQEAAALARCARAAKLQRVKDLLAGHFNGAGHVAERVHGDDLAVGNVARRDICTDAAAVHERDVRVEQGAVCIGAKVAEVRLLIADHAFAGCRVLHRKCNIRLRNDFVERSFVLQLDLRNVCVHRHILLCVIRCRDEARGHRAVRLDDEAAEVPELVAGGGQDHVFVVLVLYRFTRDGAVGMAVKHHVDARGVCDHFAGCPRAALRVDAKVRDRDDIVHTLCLCRIHGSLHGIIKLLAVAAGAEAVNVVPVFILEIRRRGLRDGFRRGDADESDLLAAEIADRICIEHGLCRVALDVLKVAGKILERCFSRQFLNAAHAVIELVVAVNRIVIAARVHDVDEVPAGGKRADRFSLDRIAAVHKGNVRRDGFHVRLVGGNARIAHVLIHVLVNGTVHVVGVKDHDVPRFHFAFGKRGRHKRQRERESQKQCQQFLHEFPSFG